MNAAEHTKAPEKLTRYALDLACEPYSACGYRYTRGLPPIHFWPDRTKKLVRVFFLYHYGNFMLSEGLKSRKYARYYWDVARHSAWNTIVRSDEFDREFKT